MRVATRLRALHHAAATGGAVTLPTVALSPALRLRGDDLVGADGATPATCSDASGHSRTWTLNGSASKKTGVANGHAALRLNGSSQYALADEAAAFLTGVEATIYAVVVRRGTFTFSGVASLVKEGTANDYSDLANATFANEGSGSSVQTNDRGAPLASIGSHPGNDVPFLVSTHYQSLGGIDYSDTIRRITTAGGEVTANSTPSAAVNFDVDRVYLGTRWASGAVSNFYTGDILDFVIYPGYIAVGGADDVAIVAALRTGYGI